MASPATNNPLGSDDPSPQSNISSKTIHENLDAGKVVLVADNQIVVVKRPKGPPLASNNKPKPPTFMSVGLNNAFLSHVMKMDSDADVISSLSQFTFFKRTGIIVLHVICSIIRTISFRHEGPFNGRFELVSLRGIVIPDGSSGPSSLSFFMKTNEPSAKVIDGMVNGPIVIAGPVLVTTTTFSSTTIEKLSLVIQKNGILELGSVTGQKPGSGGYTLGYSNMDIGNWLGGGG